MEVNAQEEQIEAQEGHDGEEAMTTQKKCVEEQKEMKKAICRIDT